MLRQLYLFVEALHDIRFPAFQYILLPRLFSIKRIIPQNYVLKPINYKHDINCDGARDIFCYYSFYVYSILIFLMQKIILSLFSVILKKKFYKISRHSARGKACNDFFKLHYSDEQNANYFNLSMH